MSRNFLPAILLLFYLILLLMCCAMCESAAAEDSAGTQQNALVLFNSETNFKNGGTGAPTKQFKSFTSPSLSYVGNVLVVFAQASENGDGKKCDIVEGYFKIEDDGGLSDKDEKSTSKIEWKKQVTTNDEDKCAGDPTFVVKDKTDIFLFFKNSSCTKDDKVEYWIRGGKFNEIDGSKGITWESFEDLIEKQKLSSVELKEVTSVASGSSGIFVNETFVVPVWYTKNNNNFASVITKKSGTDQQNWNFESSEKPPVEGMYPAVVGWKEKLIMMTSKKEGLRKVYESINMGKTWTTAVGSLSNMWGKTKEPAPTEPVGRNGFITVEIKINNKEEKVMLFTKPVKNQKYNLHLWMSDYQRVSLA